MVKNVEVKLIESYEDLKNSKGGELILINGRMEFVIDKYAHHLERFGCKKDKIYTLSIEGDYLVQNHYGNYLENDDEFLEPSMKTSCRKGSDTALENVLSKIALEGGLIK